VWGCGEEVGGGGGCIIGHLRHIVAAQGRASTAEMSDNQKNAS